MNTVTTWIGRYQWTCFRCDGVETYLHAPRAYEMNYPFTAEIETTFETFVEYDRNVPAGIGKKAIVKFLKVY